MRIVGNARGGIGGHFVLCPGLNIGIQLDEEKLARYGEKFFEITSRGIALKTIREKGLFTALRLARKKKRPKLES